MAKHVILEAYSFSPSTKTVVVNGKNIRKEQLLLITNTTTGTVIYNFSDPNLVGAVQNAANTSTGQETTTITLNYNTASMNVADKLAILTEETYQEMIPSETMRDPVDKLRVSEPQALIDTDFEYGTQPTKWEAINILNNRPSAFYDITSPIVITGMTGFNKVVTVTTTAALAVGTPIFVQGTLDDANAGGWWLVETSSGSQFTYTVTNTPAVTLYDATKTYVFNANFYTGSAIPAGTSAVSLSGTTGTVTTTGAHGLRVGNAFYISGTSGVANLNSSWVVASTPTTNTFTFNTTLTGAVTTALNASIYPRALGYVQHRAFDGGVQFTNVQPYHGYQVIRQTRRQFRYQSGKAMQFSTGSILKPALQVESITNGGSGTTITVKTKYPHGLATGAVVSVTGMTVTNELPYNNTNATVATVADPLTFTYTANSAPSVSPATAYPITISPLTWYGSSNRVGLFDQQNGVFFEADGQTIYCVRRKSTDQISGYASFTAGSNLMTGTATARFSTQLKPNDNVVIRGMTYLIQAIASDTVAYIYPEYRGTTVANATVSKTTELRIPQSQWNIDKMDGTGHSLMNLDLTKMQMFYIDYTWYGAGAVRFGFKNNRGEVVYCHRMPNNNVNTEAYMRTGNLVARYETNTLPIRTFLAATLTSGITSLMTVESTAAFPPAGYLMITQGGLDVNGVIEYIQYTGKTATTFTGLTRNVTNLAGQGFINGGGSASATTHTYDPLKPAVIESYSPAQASTISHWGSSVIMDGKYDNDKSIQFNFGQNTPLVYSNLGSRVGVMSIRAAPSVDNGLSGLLGAREIINRMQINPVGVSVYPITNGVKVDIVLNARVSGANTWTNVGGSSLTQYASHANNSIVTGGETIYTFFAPAGGVNSQDLNTIRDLGTSVLGGGTNSLVSNVPQSIYPDGPDILTVCITALSGAATAVTRLSWTEAQA